MSVSNDSAPSIINLEALQAKAIGELPSHFQNAWTELEESDGNAGAWFGETVYELEQQVIKAMQQRVIETLSRSAMVDLGILGQKQGDQG